METGTLRFGAIMQIRDGNPYVLVSAARARRLKADWRRPMPVVVLRVNRLTTPTPWRRINMMPTGTVGSTCIFTATFAARQPRRSVIALLAPSSLATAVPSASRSRCG